ncbi:15063_t:CDS:2, partial [Funneliformis mosseae]
INISSTVLKFLSKTYLSLDPYMRGRMRVCEKNEKNYINAFSVGKVMEAGGVGVVIASNNDQWKKASGSSIKFNNAISIPTFTSVIMDKVGEMMKIPKSIANGVHTINGINIDMMRQVMNVYMVQPIISDPTSYKVSWERKSDEKTNVIINYSEGENHTIQSAFWSDSQQEKAEERRGWEEYTKVSPAAAKNALLYKQALKDALDIGISLSYFLGLLDMPGMTAYVGLFMIGKPKQGETIFISTAAGAVGQVVGQIAKIKGLKVVGSTGDDSKVDYILNELKFDHAFNYKKVDIDQTLKETCSEGIDIYFDNVGGETLDIVLTHLNINARVIACGMISQYNNAKSTSYGIKNLGLIIPRRIIVHGFIVFDHYKEYYESFQKDMVQWLKEGKLKYKEYVVNGIEMLLKLSWICLMVGRQIKNK